MAVLVSDSFNRGNSTTTLGTTDSYAGGSAKTWTVYQAGGNGAVYGINNNQAYSPSIGTNTDDQFAGFDIAQSNVSVTATFSNLLGKPFIVLRSTAYNSYISLQADGAAYSMYEYNGSTWTKIGTGGTPTTGDIMKVTLNGNSITVYRNGTQIFTTTSTFNQTSTIFGFNLHTNSSNLLDNFIVEDSSTAITHNGAASTQGVSTITAAATLIPAAITGSASLQGVANVSATANVINAPMLGSSSLQGIGAVTATASIIRSGSASLTGVSTVTAFAAGLTVPGSASLTGVGTLTASGVSGTFITAGVNLVGDSALSVALMGDKVITASLQATMNTIANIEASMPDKVALWGEI